MLGVYWLKRLWSRALMARRGLPVGSVREALLDQLVLDAVGLGLEQAQQYLLNVAPAFDEFERWIVVTTGGIDPVQVERINATIAGAPVPEATRCRLEEVEAMAPVLTAEDLRHWEEHGYVIVHDAVTGEMRCKTEQAIWNHLGARPDEPDSWYVPNDHGIMVQFFQHPAFTANRRCRRIHKAFAQLWGTVDLWAATDRVGFNVPERPGWKFRGPHMHWDVSLTQPIPFGTQGILYLTDTPPEQGAFTCVPEFHRKIDAWLESLPAGADPRMQDLHALGSRPIAGRAGDLIIWDHKLPHAARANFGARPRMVQYMNMYPATREAQEIWR
jgi:hypothetical protein